MMINPTVASLITATGVGAAAGYLGSLMLTRRMALVGDALGHVALPGMGLAILLGMDPSLGAFVFVALGSLLVWRLGERTVLSMETLVGIVFVTSLALGFLIVPQPELLESLIGDIARISAVGMLAAVMVSIGVVLLVMRIYPGMILLSISEDLAAVEGISKARCHFLYLSAVALIVSVGVRVTGSLLVGALVIIPPASARLLGGSLRRYGRLSLIFGATSGGAGILVSTASGFAPGPAIILVSAGFFVTAVVLSKLAHCRVDQGSGFQTPPASRPSSTR